MKPSERIREIIDHIDLAETNPLPRAILQYLDEEYEKNQPTKLTCTCGSSEYCGVHEKG